jgi:diacylglycerol diphosphate phosphatase/phosphatidate phosphatase
MIAISRCEDYRHDVYDVTVGSLLGFTVAYATYRRYYPSLRSSKCATPYSNPADSSNGFTKVKDEEERIRGANEFELDEFDEEEDESRPLNSRR